MSNTNHGNHGMPDAGNVRCRECAAPGLFSAGANFGYSVGYADALHDLAVAVEVENVYRNGDYTVLKFADGEKIKVKYDPSYGYAYDTEKAMMAALLKRLMGNHYIAMLKKFCPAGTGATVSGRDMLKREPVSTGDASCDPDDEGLAGAFRGEDGWQSFLEQLDREHADGFSEAHSAHEPDPESEGMAEAFEGVGGEDVPSDAMPDDGSDSPGVPQTGDEPDAGMAGAFPESDASFFGACE